MNTTIDQIEKIIPSRYVPYVMFLVLCLPYVGRAIAALRNDHGIMGVFRGIVWGDPKDPGAVKLADATATQQFFRQQAYVPPASPIAATVPAAPPQAPSAPPIDKPAERSTVAP